MFKFKREDPKSEAEKKLQELKDLLFPEPSLQKEGEHEFYVEYSVDWNIESVISDIERGHIDETCQKTLASIEKRLFHARKILQAYYEMDQNVKYIYVDDLIPRNIDTDY
jgi:hypothetical protein